jgi:hypothetical protein
VKLGDFGLIRLVNAGGADLTQATEVMGTPLYMSPEQARESRDVDFRSDIYNLGCTLYHLLVGRTPYKGEDSVAVILQHINAPTPSLRQARPAAPKPLVALLDKMLAKNPRHRFASYELLIAEMQRVRDALGEARLGDPAPGEQPRSGMWTWLPWLAVAAGVGAAALILAPDAMRSARRFVGMETPVVSKEDAIAEEQVRQMIVELKRLNPGFDGRETHRVERGRVVELFFSTAAVTNLSPVRVLTTLRSLGCSGGARAKPLADLSPLRGLPLAYLDFNHSIVSDLEPLRGMKLLHLNCSDSLVRDLSPLQSMPLKSLHCAKIPLADLAPLRGLPLVTLLCADTAVADLSPLQGAPLKNLHCRGTRVRDLSPLQGMPLEELDCINTPVSDLAPLQNLPLRVVHCNPLLTKSERSTAVLRGIKSLQTINDRPAAEMVGARGGR